LVDNVRARISNSLGCLVLQAPTLRAGSGGPLSLETSVLGVFASGDVRSGSVKRLGWNRRASGALIGVDRSDR
jgi:thioredoxin reductase